MRKIERPASFRRDYKRESRGRYHFTIDHDLLPILNALIKDVPLELRYRDHMLTGKWKDYRECHIKPDLLLIY